MRFTLAFALAYSITSSAAYSAPLLEDGYVDTQQDTLADIFPDLYVVSSDADLDYESIAVVDQPIHGTVVVDGYMGMLTYEPEPGYYGFDAFSYTIEDVNGQVSNVAWIYIYVEPYGEWLNSAPLIANFVVEKGFDEYWTFHGTVLDENAFGLTVTFGGVLEGYTTTVNDSGAFYLTIPLGPNDEGPVTAETEDEYGVLSNLARDYIIQP